MRREESEYDGSDVDTIFAATRNSWFYHHALAPGDDAYFDLNYLQEQISVTIMGPPDHPAVHAIIADWTAELN